MSGSMSGMWKRSHAEQVRHRQKEGAATDMFYSHRAPFRERRCGVGGSSGTILAFNPTERGTYGCERADVRRRRCSVFAGRDAFLARLWPRIRRADRSAEHGAIHYLDSAANAFSSCARPLATGPTQERIHGLS
jgi:hypothetical protein